MLNIVPLDWHHDYIMCTSCNIVSNEADCMTLVLRYPHIIITCVNMMIMHNCRHVYKQIHLYDYNDNWC